MACPLVGRVGALVDFAVNTATVALMQLCATTTAGQTRLSAKRAEYM